MKDKSTTRPWKLAGEAPFNAQYFCIDIPNQPMIEIKGFDNANLIVRAVNSHDELIEFVNDYIVSAKKYEDFRPFISDVENILKRAKGEL